jgi:hypothetical protein
MIIHFNLTTKGIVNEEWKIRCVVLGKTCYHIGNRADDGLPKVLGD